MTEKRELGEGTIEVQLIDSDGQAHIHHLKPSLGAFKTLSRKYGGLRSLVDKLDRLDFDAVVDTIAAGMNVPLTAKRRDELEQAVFRTGITDDTGQLGEMCVQYVICLMRGGKRPGPPEGQAEGNSDAPQA